MQSCFRAFATGLAVAFFAVAPALAQAPPPVPDNPALAQALNFVVDMKVAVDYAKDNATMAGMQQYAKRANDLAGAAAATLPQAAAPEGPAVQADLRAVGASLPPLQAGLARMLAAPDLPTTSSIGHGVSVIARLQSLTNMTQALIDRGDTGTITGTVLNPDGSPAAGAWLTINGGVAHKALLADTGGNFTATNVPAFKNVEVKAYSSTGGAIYVEDHVDLAHGATGNVTLKLAPNRNPAANPVVASPGATQNPDGTLTLTLAGGPAPGQVLSDQVFAFAPALGASPGLLPQPDGTFRASYKLPPGAPKGTATFYFFAVDEQCHLSSALPVDLAIS